MIMLLQGLVLDNSELREHNHGLLVHTSELLHGDFAPWLPKAVAAALASCAQVRTLMHLLHIGPLHLLIDTSLVVPRPSPCRNSKP